MARSFFACLVSVLGTLGLAGIATVWAVQGPSFQPPWAALLFCLLMAVTALMLVWRRRQDRLARTSLCLALIDILAVAGLGIYFSITTWNPARM